MGDCGCRLATGCSTRKSDQARLISETVARMYPTRRWNEIDDRERFRAGVPAELSRKLARVASEVLQARTWYREGGEDDLCDYLWILCVGREPALYDIREGEAAPESDKITEKYLRVALSSLVRAATIQEVELRLRRRDQTVEIRESTRDGVYDPVLLKRMQRMVDLLRQAELEHFDFGMLCEDAPSEPQIDFTDYSDRYGAQPTAVALLFYPQPPITTSTVFYELP